MSWENELKETIKLTSPSGTVFEALWINNERSFEKKLGLFDPPKTDGTIAQDNGSASIQYPLTIYFDGPFHNNDAELFFNTLFSEKGQWEIVHPVKGTKALQLVSAQEDISPVENGNYTSFDMVWFEPANITILISSDELTASILTQLFVAFDDALLILQQLRSDAYSLIQASVNVMNKVAGFMDLTIQEIAVTDSIVQESYLSARAAFNNAIEAYGVDNSETDDVGNALIDMALAPIDASSSFTDRFTAYSALIDNIITLTPSTVTRDDLNRIIAQEYSMTLPLIVIAQIVATSVYTNRTEIISAIDNVFTIFNTVVANLESAQALYIDLDIDFQYFSQTQTYTSLVNIYTLVLKYLLSQFFNLNAEKRFTLKNDKSPLRITIEEYGNFGENDENYDLFISSNKLSGNDILLLPAGREVVIYA